MSADVTEADRVMTRLIAGLGRRLARTGVATIGRVARSTPAPGILRYTLGCEVLPGWVTKTDEPCPALGPRGPNDANIRTFISAHGAWLGSLRRPLGVVGVVLVDVVGPVRHDGQSSDPPWFSTTIVVSRAR